jgi:hypothetical protein
MKPNVFLGYHKKGISCSLSLFGHEQYSSNSPDQNNSAHGVYNVPHWRYCILLGFGRAIQYPSNCWKIWYGAQTISRIPRMGYCMFIKYFALWTWIQHALNMFKLNWSSVSLWLSTWLGINTLSPWKIVVKNIIFLQLIFLVMYGHHILDYFCLF